MSKDPDPFTPDDIDLLQKVLSLVPDLKVVAHAAKAGRSRLSYPVNSFEDLLPVFEGDTFAVGGWRTSATIAKKHFPAVFFPITSEDDFIAKVYIVLAIGVTSHVRGRYYVPGVEMLKKLNPPLDAIRRTQPQLFEDTE